MKKYLMSGALALIAGLFVTSCHDDDVYENINVIDQKTQGFQKAFKEAFGEINPNQTWGFKQTNVEPVIPTSTSSKVTTRALTRAADAEFERWQSDRTWTKPNDIIVEERDYVLKYLQEHPNGGYKTLNVDTYIIQVVGGGHHSYDGGKDHNGASQKISDATNQMNYCCINGKFTQYNNGHDMNTEDAILIKNLPATDATYHDSNADITVSDHYAFYFITFPNDSKYGYMAGKTGCYLCFDYYTYKDGEKWGVDADGIYDDWVIKLSPADGGTITPPTSGEEDKKDDITYEYDDDIDIRYEYAIIDTIIDTGRILCEDLGNYSNREDLDYNDVVFNAQIIKKTYKTTTITTTITIEKKFVNGIYDSEREYGRKTVSKTETMGSQHFAKVDLYAAGGTLEISVLGQEVHNLFGVGVTTMVNTRDKNTPTVNGANTVVRDPVEMINPNFEKERPTYENFKDDRSEKDKEKDKYLFAGYERIIDIPIRVCYQEGEVLELKSEPGKAPHKILVDKDARWPSERCNISKAYSLFERYVQGEVNEFCSSGANDDYLYDKEQTISTEAEGDVKETVTGQGNVTLNVLWKSEEGYDISRGLYFTNTDLLKNQGIKEGDRLRFEGSIMESGSEWAIFLSDGNSSRLHSDLTSLNNHEYAEVTLTKDLVDKLLANNTNAAMVISGYNVLLTRVSLIKK